MLIKLETNFNNDTNKYELLLLVKVPNVQIKNDLNFRIFSLKNNEDVIVHDPIIYNSNYVFKLNQSFVNRDIYFIFSFDKNQFESIKELTFGLCHEKISWIINDINYINPFFIGKDQHVDFIKQISYEISVLDANEVKVNNTFEAKTTTKSTRVPVLGKKQKTQQQAKQNKYQKKNQDA